MNEDNQFYMGTTRRQYNFSTMCEIIYQPEKPQKHIWGLSKPQVH